MQPHHRFLVPALLGAALLLFSASARAAEPDFTIELGKRVGAIKKNTTLAQLKEAYGAKNVKSTDLPGPEGSTIKGVILFEGGKNEMHVVWNEEKLEKEILEVMLIGPAWVIEGKLKLGASLADVEAVNGKAFEVGGFDWDLGGYVNFEGGKLEQKVMVRMYPSGESDESLSGEKQIPSGDKKLRKAKPTVTDLSIIFR